jgi:hypothetical protein
MQWKGTTEWPMAFANTVINPIFDPTTINSSTVANDTMYGVWTRYFKTCLKETFAIGCLIKTKQL